MPYYEKIEFQPIMEIGGYKNTAVDRRIARQAWAEHVACAVLNHLKDDCCMRITEILEVLVEAGRIDLLPGSQSGKKPEEIELRSLSGAAAQRLKAAFNGCDHLYIGQIAIMLHEEEIYMEDLDDHYRASFYHIMLHPDDIGKMRREGKLPKVRKKET